MKKKVFIFVILLLIIIIITICILWHKGIIFSKNNDKPIDKNDFVTIVEEETYLEKNEDGIIIDVTTNEELFNLNIDYSLMDPGIGLLENRKPEELSEWDLISYVKGVFNAYPEQSFDNFNDEEKAVIILLASGLYTPRTIEEIQAVAKKYFSIYNYELPTGTYKLANIGEYTLTKTNGYYILSRVSNKINNINVAWLTDTKINGNQIELTFDYAPDGFVLAEGCYTPVLEVQEEGCIMGTYKVYLTYYGEENRLNIDKIVYEKNDK